VLFNTQVYTHLQLDQQVAWRDSKPAAMPLPFDSQHLAIHTSNKHTHAQHSCNPDTHLQLDQQVAWWAPEPAAVPLPFDSQHLAIHYTSWHSDAHVAAHCESSFPTAPARICRGRQGTLMYKE
jgi:hypothetical protein